MNTTITTDMIAKSAPGTINGFCDDCNKFGPVLLAEDDFLCETHAAGWLAKEAALATFNNDTARERDLQNDPQFAAIWLRWDDSAAVTGSFKEIGAELYKLYVAWPPLTPTHTR